MSDELHWSDEIHWLSSTIYSSGFLPVNAPAEDNILNLNCINSFILYSSTNRLSNGIHYNNNRGPCCYICFQALYFHNLSLLSAVLLQTVNTSERPFCIRYL